MAREELEKIRTMVNGFKDFAERIDNGENIKDEELKDFAEGNDMTIEEVKEGLEDREQLQQLLDTDVDEMEKELKEVEDQIANMDPKEKEKMKNASILQSVYSQQREPTEEEYKKFADATECSVEEAKDTFEEMKFMYKPREDREEDDVDFDSMSDKEEEQYWKVEFARRDKLWEKDVLTDNDIHDLCEQNSITRKEVMEMHGNYIPEKASATNNLGLLGWIIKFIKGLF